MHSSKRTLRSNEIQLPTNGSLLDTELDLNFSLQYPHFVKRDGNRLQIFLQRRKKYKNRTILGYKTLAEGFIRMDQVLQKSMNTELELYTNTGNSKSDKADKGDRANVQAGPLVVARLTIHQLSSMPVDHDSKNNNTLLIMDRGYSDEEEEMEFSSVEDNEEGMLSSIINQRRGIDYDKRNISYNKLDRYLGYIGNKTGERDSDERDSEFENSKPRKRRKRKIGPNREKQPSMKQKIIALLKKFRDREEPSDTHTNETEGCKELDEFFKEFESLSCVDESGQENDEELDNISIGSTPKPSLRPFFASSRSLIHQDSAPTQHPLVSPVPKQQVLDKFQQQDKSLQTSSDSSNQNAKEKKYSSNNQTNTENNDGWWGRPLERGASGPDGSLLPYLDQDDSNDLIIRDMPLTETISSSPPREKDEKKSRLLRSSTSGPVNSSKKKQSLSISTDQQLKPLISEHSAQSPTNTEPRRSFLEQVNRVLGADDLVMPDVMTLIHPARDGPSAAFLASRLIPILPQPTLNPHNPHEVRSVLQSLLNRICKVCNTSAKTMQPVRVILIGPDALVSSALRAYVDLWAMRPPDWGAHVRFYIVPLGLNYISRYLASIDSGYAILFGSDGWHNLCERAADGSVNDINDLTNRINRYASGIGPTVQLPIAEAMVAYREKLSDDESSQIFVPFIHDIKIGAPESAQHSVDLEEALGPPGGSPPAAGLRPSPPNTPAPSIQDSTSLVSTVTSYHWEPLELQVDYWQLSKQSDSQNKSEDISTRKKIEGHLKSAAGVTNTSSGSGAQSGISLSANVGTSKGSIKSTFRFLEAARLSPGIDPQSLSSFLITYTTKEKKQKIMRLGKKKEKDKDMEIGRSQTLDGVTRLICSAKSSNSQLRVYIDGAEWNSVKFFQLSLQWQTHVKNFPVALIGAPLAPQELS